MYGVQDDRRLSGGLPLGWPRPPRGPDRTSFQEVLFPAAPPVSEQCGLPEEDRLVLESWKHPVSATFVLERHLSKGSIFINPETGKVYLVKGLTQKWSEMFPWAKPPIVLEATLIPFCGCIISDGLVAPLRVSLGPGYQESFNSGSARSPRPLKVVG